MRHFAKAVPLSIPHATILHHPFHDIVSEDGEPLVTNISAVVLKALGLIFLVVSQAVLL